MDSIRDGAIDFIVKPFERERVLALLAKLEKPTASLKPISTHVRPVSLTRPIVPIPNLEPDQQPDHEPGPGTDSCLDRGRFGTDATTA